MIGKSKVIKYKKLKPARKYKHYYFEIFLPKLGLYLEYDHECGFTYFHGSSVVHVAGTAGLLHILAAHWNEVA